MIFFFPKMFERPCKKIILKADPRIYSDLYFFTLTFVVKFLKLLCKKFKLFNYLTTKVSHPAAFDRAVKYLIEKP